MMMKNIWSLIEIRCTDHDEPIPMYVFEGSATPFYACPKYMLKDDAHPNGHLPHEKGCANRLSFEDVRHLVEQLGKMMAEDEEQDIIFDYTGTKLKWKTVEAVVLEYSYKKIVLGVHNRRQIGTWRN